VRELGEARGGGGGLHAPIIDAVSAPEPSDADLEAAVERLSDPERFREAEARVARVAPGLQRILTEALHSGGWFGEAHEGELLKAATTPDQEERLRAVRTLLAEETRMGMLVGVAVGWELARELDQNRQED
jgi:hypothetical protein